MADHRTAPRRVLLIDPGATTADQGATARGGLAAALQAHPAFAVLSAPGAGWDRTARDEGIDLVAIPGSVPNRAELIDAALADGCDVLALPPSATGDRSSAVGAADDARGRLLPLFPHRYAPALWSAAAALAGGRIGLPWNVQVDYLVSGAGAAGLEQLIDQAAGTVDAVLSLLRLPALRVYVPVRDGRVDGTLTLQCDHDHEVLSTIVVGSVAAVPGDDGFGIPVIRHRYRMAGSHGELLVDGLRPRVRVSRPQGRGAHWDGPTALSGLLDAVATGAGIPGAADIAAVQGVLAAARRSVQERRPVAVEPVAVEPVAVEPVAVETP